MRKNITDNYMKIGLIGNNPFDIKFMHYLFESQGLQGIYDSNYEVVDKEKDKILERIAYYFGSNLPILIDDNGLRNIFEKYDIKGPVNNYKLGAIDIINQINYCLESDAVYVCNYNGEINKYMSFILGYLMSKKQEIFFWDDIKDSEWLMASITRNNGHGLKETIVYPLEIVRTLAFPYLLNVNNKGKKYGVERNINFNINANREDIIPKTVVLLGSLRKQLDAIKEQAFYYKENGYDLLAPKISAIKKDDNGFIIFADDLSDEPITIEKDFLEKCLKSEEIVICDKDGYVGNTVMMEIGYILGKGKKIKFVEEPAENWLIDCVNYLEEKNVKERRI